MGWKRRVRGIAARDADAVPPELLAEASDRHSRRWPTIQNNAIRIAILGVAAIAVVCWVMHGVALSYELNNGRFYAALGITSVVFAGLFCSLGESVFEDAVKSVIIAITGCLFAGLFPLPWCLVPGAGAVIGSIVNRTIQRTSGRHI